MNHRLLVAGAANHRVRSGGQRLGRDPAPFHPGEVVVEEHPIRGSVHAAIALEAWDHGLPTRSRVLDAEPRLAFALPDPEGRDPTTGAAWWRAPSAGFRGGTPRRTPVLRHSGFRCLAAMLRGFTGGVTIEKLGCRAHEADLAWPEPGGLMAPTPGLQPAADLPVHTLRRGVQETLLDGPTREQATCVGDAHPVARRLFHLTGDARHGKRLVTARFARPTRSGPFEVLVRTVVLFAFLQMLLDHELIAITGTADDLRHTRDAATVRGALPAARGVSGWFERQFDDHAFCAVMDDELPRGGGLEATFAQDAVDRARNARLFIDHAGTGWHNFGEPGIDRRGLNAALQACLCVTERALAELEEVAGGVARAATLRARADARAGAAGARFFNAPQSAFVDAELDGEKLARLCQPANAWAALTGWFGRGGVPAVVAVLCPLLDSPPADAAQGGPSLWIYAAPVRRGAGLAAPGPPGGGAAPAADDRRGGDLAVGELPQKRPRRPLPPLERGPDRRSAGSAVGESQATEQATSGRR